jgi:small subunit ribosomal protein S9
MLRRGEPTLAETNKSEYYYGMGRRKTAVARVRLFPNGDGSVTVNGKSAQAYFGQVASHLATISAPLHVLDLGNAYTMTIRVIGGGTSGQAGAIRHALARALVRMNPDFKGPLRKAGFLTRDPRMKERKKYGLKRARKAPQYTKR